jgi:hypothetical protein
MFCIKEFLLYLCHTLNTKQMETLKRKRGRPRKTENEFTPITNEIVIVQPKSVIKQKKLEDKIFGSFLGESREVEN